MQKIKVTISPDYVATIHCEGECSGLEDVKLLRAANRVKASLKELRYTLTHLKTSLTEEEKGRYRMRFLNIKALELLACQNISLWNNCRDDEAMSRQLAEYGIVPPLDLWDAEWSLFLEYCQCVQSKRIQQWEEQRRWAQKMLHIINIKEQRLRVLVNTIEFNTGFAVKVTHNFSIYPRPSSLNYGKYHVKLYIGEHAELMVELRLDMIDTCTPQVVEAVKRLNDLYSKLTDALTSDEEKYGVSLRVLGSYHLYYYYYEPERLVNDSYLRLSYSRNDFDNIEDESFASRSVINEMNHIFSDLVAFINQHKVARVRARLR